MRRRPRLGLGPREAQVRRGRGSTRCSGLGGCGGPQATQLSERRERELVRRSTLATIFAGHLCGYRLRCRAPRRPEPVVPRGVDRRSRPPELATTPTCARACFERPHRSPSGAGRAQLSCTGFGAFHVSPWKACSSSSWRMSSWERRRARGRLRGASDCLRTICGLRPTAIQNNINESRPVLAETQSQESSEADSAHLPESWHAARPNVLVEPSRAFWGIAARNASYMCVWGVAPRAFLQDDEQGAAVGMPGVPGPVRESTRKGSRNTQTWTKTSVVLSVPLALGLVSGPWGDRTERLTMPATTPGTKSSSTVELMPRNPAAFAPRLTNQG